MECREKQVSLVKLTGKNVIKEQYRPGRAGRSGMTKLLNKINEIMDDFSVKKSC